MSNYSYIYKTEPDLLTSPGKVIEVNNNGITGEVCYWIHTLFTQNKGNHDVFVETGTNTGGGINIALSCELKKLYSVEINPEFYNFSKERWKNRPEVSLYLGDSKSEFPNILSQINEPALFWLDAHISNGDSTYIELDYLKNHPIKTHTILVDDISVYFDRDNVIKEIYKINPNYNISYGSTWRGQDEILIAKIV